jgi:hypothetical protein
MKTIQYFLVLILSFFAMSANLHGSCEYSEQLYVKDFSVGNLLSWTTKKEINHLEFVIERSLDGVAYAQIGTTVAKGDASENKYSFLDISATKGQSYYRLKEVNKDGTHQYSAVAVARMSLNNNFTIVSLSPPNADGTLEMVINSKNKSEINYEIRDLENVVYYSAKQQLNDGVNILSIDLVEDLLKTGRVFRIAIQGEAESEILTFRSDGY